MKKKAIGIIIGVILLGGCVNSMSNNSTSKTTSTYTPSVSESAPVSENIIVEEEKEVSNLTVSQENAIKKAESYIRYSGFSRQGLIEQLEFEGFSNADSIFAVDNITVDWNEECAEKAQNYMEYSSFSRQGLIEQLEFEGFTSTEIEYGVAAVGY